MASNYSIATNAIRLANGGAWFSKSRILGFADIRIAKVHRIMQRLKSSNQLVDITGALPMKSLVFLDNGWGILSPITVLTLSKQFNATEKTNEA